MFSLFSKKVSDDIKARMAARLLSFEKPEARLNLPEYPTVTEGSELWDFVQPHSWDFLMTLRVEADWQDLAPRQVGGERGLQEGQAVCDDCQGGE